TPSAVSPTKGRHIRPRQSCSGGSRGHGAGSEFTLFPLAPPDRDSTPVGNSHTSPSLVPTLAVAVGRLADLTMPPFPARPRSFPLSKRRVRPALCDRVRVGHARRGLLPLGASTIKPQRLRLSIPLL